MPSGDAQRVWFPEMIEILVAEWSPAMTWDELAQLCGRLSELRTELRATRGIEGPLTRCRKCGRFSRGEIEGVSIRSALFALQKASVLSHDDMKRLELDWKKHRAARRLDRLGRDPRASAPASIGDRSGCC